MAQAVAPGVPVGQLVAVLLHEAAVPPEMAAALRQIGLTRLDVWRRLVAEWLTSAAPDEVGEAWLPAALLGAAAAPDPDAAVLNLWRLQDELSAAVLLRQIAADPRFGHDLLFLLGLGSLPGDSLVREPGLVDLLLEPDLLAGERNAARLATEATQMILRLRQPETRQDALRRWKRGQFLRIIARDFLLHQPQQVITREISAVADACVGAALAAAADEAGLALDADGAPLGLAVIAMGKWGSWELNYNSDIDLICVYLPTPSGPTADGWEQVVRSMARCLDATTTEGQVFRVDFRLRPEGASGSLARSLESCAVYYQTQGAAWESQALTRARFAAGDPEAGRQFAELATTVAFGTRVGRAGIASIRRNRERLDQRAEADRDVKEGRGGIRDIEFTTQLLQLVRGVTDPAVRARNTWDALAALTRAGAIAEHERRTLSEAYDFLRRVEHLLQIQPVAPTRLLPTDRGALRRLARGLGYRDSGPLQAGTRFLEDYRSHTAAARELCQRLFFNPIPFASPDADQAIQDLLDPVQDDAEVLRYLADIPFNDPPQARRRLLFLAHGEPPMRLPAEVLARFVDLLPTLLTCIQRMPGPDESLYWFERFIASAGGRELLYSFLLEQPPVIELLCRLGGYSDALSQTIIDHPEYLDLVIDPRFMGRQPTRDDLAAELARRAQPLHQAADRLDDLRRFRRREHFRIGVQDLLGALELEQVTAELSDLADVSLERLLAEARQAVPGAANLPLAILGCGKLGGREIHYSSDLDVLFVYASDDPDAMRVAEQVARTVVAEAHRRNRAGWLYDVDARLRPFGANSPLMRTVAGYEAYYARSGAVWERLAMSRARPVAGDVAVGQNLADILHAFAFDRSLSTDDRAELRRVKHRIETERRDPADRRHLDLKLDPGGIMDVEFLAQILQITAGPDGPREANTPAALAALAAAGALPGPEADLLQRNYRILRRIEFRLQIVIERSSGLLPLDPDGLAAAAKRLGWSLAEASRKPEQLVADLRERMRAVREIYERRVGLEA